ncbi:mitochondrial mRNA pseudouridine synthase Trub2 [Chrysoperla carnea]|uniref:mitochondrial mRNA pseudouridine synthase Trub2 n=1 Tax=Chrysoperla carnea TaxID=189513 RepID=UPI001D0820D8|nr:mitochondrial mRNA pseudouridine synthase Trub2 [Chrysoperla carnea]
MPITRNSETVFKLLNGIVCVYKPAEVSLKRLCSQIKTKLCEELSQLEGRPRLANVIIKGDPSKQLSVHVESSYSDHPAVLGPSYKQVDFRCNPVLNLGFNTSGVTLIGINDGTKTAYYMNKNYRTRAYRIKGRFGLASDTYYKDGKFVEKSTFRHIKKYNLDNLLASIQASHQKKKFELWGVDIQSQAAYELAVSDYVKPEITKTPLLYGIKCVEFNLPYFTIEIHSINEYEKYLHTLIHDIGMNMKSTAHCTGVQCIRHSFYTTENALLKKHWTLQNVLDNIQNNRKIYFEKTNAIQNNEQRSIAQL